jgi:uncharacterized membrane protein YbhN (UPF0104 family)
MPRLQRWHRVVISLATLGVLLAFIPIRDLAASMGQVSPAVLALSLVAFIAAHVGGAFKWRLLQGDAAPPLLPTLRAHFAGVVANLWLPGVVGGDLVRVGVVYRQSARPAAVAVASLVDRLIDSASLVGLAFIGLLTIAGPAQAARRAFLVIIAVGLAGAAILAVAVGLFLKRAHGARMGQIREALELLLRRPGTVLVALFMSAAVQSAFILTNQRLGHAVGVDVSTAVWFMAWPLSKLVALVPISFAGIGVREAAIVMLMRPFTSSPDAVMASGLLWQALLITGGFLGWGVLTLLPSPPPRLTQDPVSSSTRD